MDNRADQEDVIAFLSDPHSYGPGVGSVERHETHGSIVFLAGDHAYKLKRAVKFPYMDYSTVQRRAEMCARELAVNSRMAPMLYLETRPIVSEDGNSRFGSMEEVGNAIDWVVVMRRFGQNQLLENMRQGGGLTAPLMRSLGETVARFHIQADVTREFGGASGLAAVITDNAAIMREKIGRPFLAEHVNHYEVAARSALSDQAALLDERRAKGHVRRCHGDLHLNNICLLDGQPVLFDAIEFNDRFACIDVLYDLAFLLMDLDQHDLRAAANTVFNRYLDISHEYEGLAALPLFLSCRAAVRAHTAVAAADVAKPGSRAADALRTATVLLGRAIEYLRRPEPVLIGIGGLSGTGKTTLAYALCPLIGIAPGAVVVRSDIIRKQCFGVAESVRLPKEAYAPSVTETVYERIAAITGLALASGYSVIADAVYGSENERMQLANVSERIGVKFLGLWLDARQDLLEQRVTMRRGDASDATVEVVRGQMQFVTTPQNWHHVIADAAADKTLSNACRFLGLT